VESLANQQKSLQWTAVGNHSRTAIVLHIGFLLDGSLHYNGAPLLALLRVLLLLLLKVQQV